MSTITYQPGHSGPATTVATPKDQASAIKRAAKGRKLYVNTVGDDGMWATDSFWAVDARYCAGVAALLSEYNLPLLPGAYTIGATVTTLDLDQPNIAALIPRVSDTVVIEPKLLIGRQASIVTPGPYGRGRKPADVIVDLFDVDADSVVAMNREYRKLIESMTGLLEWRQVKGSGSAGNRKLIQADGDRVIAILVPLVLR